jgi:hypothetical protein
MTQTQALESNQSVDIDLRKWTRSSIVLEALSIIQSKTDLAVDTSKILAIEKSIDSCDGTSNRCEKVFHIYMPGLYIWLHYELINGREFVEWKATYWLGE